MSVQFQVNGKNVEVEVEPRLTLADCLRHHLRLTAVEDVLNGESIDEATIAKADAATSAAVDPQDDIHASAAYRRSLVGTMVERALKSASAA